jgi:hypothetical protein
MAKQRYVKTNFRSDWYIESLQPQEKLIFLYLLTNELTNICWIYEISYKRICYDTWYPEWVVSMIISKFEEDKKIRYLDWYIVIKNHLKNQNLNPSTIAWAKREIEAIPQSVIGIIQSVYNLSAVCSTLLNLTLPNFTLLNSIEDLATSVATSETESETIPSKTEIVCADQEEESPSPSSAAPLPTRSDLDELIKTLKTTADTLWIAYNKTRDRQFAKHLMDAVEYGVFAEKLGKTRVELSVSVMKASKQISYWKWVAWWPMPIYQNYSEIYNQRVSKTQRESETKPLNSVWKLC